MTNSESPQRTPGYNTPIPAKIMTPDSVETRIGTLEFLVLMDSLEGIHQN